MEYGGIVIDALTLLSGISPIAMAPISVIRSQPTPTSAITSFTIPQTIGVLGQLGYIYARSDYSFIGPQDGRLGKYQFDYKALQQYGINFVQPAVTTNSELRYDFSWIGSRGRPESMMDFLRNDLLQDAIILEQLKLQYQNLVNTGGIRNGDTYKERAGMVVLSHIVGFSLATQWRASHPVVDPYRMQFARIYVSGRYGADVLSV